MTKSDIISIKKTFSFANKEKLELESGRVFGPITVVYETYGTLNSDKSNAVLILHSLSGDSHAAGKLSESDKHSGWWDSMIGDNKPFDTNKYFIICSNVLGGCSGTTGPSSIDPQTKQPYAMNFPFITIEDMVRVQYELIKHLNIEVLYSIAGGSMGGMQALKWAQMHPDKVRSVIPIATTVRLSPQAIAFNEVGRQSIISDVAWNKGNYYSEKEAPSKGLSIARMLGHITYLSEEGMSRKFGRQLCQSDTYQYEYLTEFQVESYLHYQGKRFTERFDANSYIYLTKAIDYFDLSSGYASLEEAVAMMKCKFLVLSYSSDWLFPTYQSLELVNALRKNNLNVSFCEIKADYGHDSFLLKNELHEKLIKGFLENI
jgi:homoserine O-acetyltransferase/O-succinyltransferase